LQHHAELRREFERWLASAQRAGLDEESIRALLSTTLRESLTRRVA
jgi:GntR family transcriptional regulator